MDKVTQLENARLDLKPYFITEMLTENKIVNNLNFNRNRRAESQNEFEVESTSREEICSKEMVS